MSSGMCLWRGTGKDGRFVVGAPWCPSSLPFEDGSLGGCRVRLLFHDFHDGGWYKANVMGAAVIVGAFPEKDERCVD